MTSGRNSFYQRLLEASLLGYVGLRELLQDKRDYDWIMEKAVRNNDVKIMDYLLESGCQIVALNSAGETALHLAAYYGYSEMLELLLSRTNYDENVTDARGFSYFHVACINGVEPMVRGFLEAGVDPELRCWFKGVWSTPLHLVARMCAKVEVAELLMNYGAQVDVRDSQGNAPLHLAVSKTGGYDVLSLLLERDSDVNARNKVGETPLQLVLKSDICQDWRAKIQILLKYEADVGVVDAEGNGVLHLALKQCRKPSFDNNDAIEALNMLLKKGADPNLENPKGTTPLQMAVSRLSLDAVRLLLDAGVRVENAWLGWTRYDELLNLKDTENLVGIVELLEDRGAPLEVKDNLIVLKLMVKHVDASVDAKKWLQSFGFAGLKDLLNLGTDANIELILSRLLLTVLNCNKTTYSEQMSLKSILNLLRQHLLMRELGLVHTSPALLSYLRAIIGSLERRLLGFLRHNAPADKLLREIQLVRESSLAGLLERDCARARKPPGLEDDELSKMFPRCASAIEGHFAKGIVRRYVMRVARRSLSDALKLPELCCDVLCGYLSNESLRDLCVAVAEGGG